MATYGVGVLGGSKSVDSSGKRKKSYWCWKRMLERCYSEKYLENKPTYKGCYVQDDWLIFSNFERWFDKNYIDGYVLDKDLIKKGNKIYSEDFCRFIPAGLNSLLTNRKLHRGESCIGVSFHKRDKVYNATCNLMGKQYHLGYYQTQEKAFLAYKCFKETAIRKTADDYYHSGKIDEEIRLALYNYTVEITD